MGTDENGQQVIRSYLESLGLKDHEKNQKFLDEAMQMAKAGEPKTVVMSYIYERTYLALAFAEDDATAGREEYKVPQPKPKIA